MRAKFVNEAFEKKDKETARSSLLFPGVKEWIEEHEKDLGNYEFVNGRLNVDGVVGINNISKLPEHLKFGEVYSLRIHDSNNTIESPSKMEFFPTKISILAFTASNCTSLEGLPKNIPGNCYIATHGVKTLEGCPKITGGFHMWNNDLESMKGGPEYVGGDFSLGDTKITSLEGCPKTVKGDFVCFGPLGRKFSEEKIREVCDIGGSVYLFSQNYERNKEYKETAKAYGGPLKTRATHVLKGVGNKQTFFSRGYKLYHILKYIDEKNDKLNPPTYVDIQRYSYEMNNGKGTYNKYSKLSDEEVEKIMRKENRYWSNNPDRSISKKSIYDFKYQNRGWGSTNMTDRGHIGSKIRKINPKEKGGGYTLNRDGYDFLDDNKHLFGKKEH